MRNMPPLLKVLILSIGGTGMIGACAAVLAPFIGLGVGEDFIAWKLFGINRLSMMKGAIWLIAVIVVLLIGWTAIHSARQSQRRNIHFQSLLRPNLQTEKNKALAKMANLAWSVLNSNWIVTILLLPFGIYVFLYFLLVTPGLPWILSDTSSFTSFNPIRTLLYPVILHVLASLSDNPTVIVWPSALLGVMATIFFSEVIQRTYRNIVLSFISGFSVLFCWPLFEHANFILSDYPYFIWMTACMALTLLALENPTRRTTLILGISIAIAIAIRPVGLILLIALPFLLLVHSYSWRRLMLWLAFPLALGLGAQSLANYWTFGFFGISRFSGLPLAGNTAFLLKPDTPTQWPELRDRIIDAIKPYRQEYDALSDAADRYQFLMRNPNNLIAAAIIEVNAYGKEKQIVYFNDHNGQKKLRAFVSSWSPLNSQLVNLHFPLFNHSVWQDALLLQLATDAHLHNAGEFLDITITKLSGAWNELLQWHGIDENYRHYQTLADGKIGGVTAISQPPTPLEPLLTPSVFNWFVSILQGMSKFYPVHLIIAVSIFTTLGWSLVRVLSGRRLSPQLAGAAFLASCVLGNALMMSIAQVPLGRYLIVAASGSSVLAFLPFYWLQSGMRNLLSARLSKIPGRNHKLLTKG